MDFKSFAISLRSFQDTYLRLCRTIHLNLTRLIATKRKAGRLKISTVVGAMHASPLPSVNGIFFTLSLQIAGRIPPSWLRGCLGLMNQTATIWFVILGNPCIRFLFLFIFFHNHRRIWFYIF